VHAFYKKIQKNDKKYQFFCRIRVMNLPLYAKSENPKFTRHRRANPIQTQFPARPATQNRLLMPLKMLKTRGCG